MCRATSAFCCFCDRILLVRIIGEWRQIKAAKQLINGSYGRKVAVDCRRSFLSCLDILITSSIHVLSLLLKSPVYHEPSVAIVVSANVVDRSIGTDNPRLLFQTLWFLDNHVTRLTFEEEKKTTVVSAFGEDQGANSMPHPNWTHLSNCIKLEVELDVDEMGKNSLLKLADASLC
ncbi:hypothetical protein Tco_1123144 [Tanacetum coccineum]|uniref:Uncharacterized protein n=1 Tax=Tanacetum coccineum TaxID=301880 RepID=A0ABQ5J2I5_9ASTR